MKKFYGKEHWYLLKRATGQWCTTASRKNKTILGRLGFAGLLMFASPNAISAADFTVDGLNYNILSADDMTVEVTYNEDRTYSGDIIIPETVTNDSKIYTVTVIGNYAFEGCSITSISIPEGVKSVGKAAFQRCTGLTSISLPDGLISLGEHCFSNCSDLESAIIPEGITTISRSCFNGCKLSSFTIPESVTTIEEHAFHGCDFTSINIPEGVTAIGDYAFNSCIYLTSITIPDNVKTIGAGAFWYDRALASVSIPNGVTTIGEYAFADNTSLQSITIPSSVTTIGNNAFQRTRLQSVTIPDGVITIGTEAFRGSTLTSTSIEIPASVKEIGYNVFGGTKIDRIEVAEGSQFYKSVDGVLYDIDVKTLIMCPSARTDGLMIPSSVTSLGEGSFYDCVMPFVTIPSSVTTIGQNAFYSEPEYTGEIYCSWQEPLVCSYCFEGATTAATLYVPEGTKAKYEAVEPWKNFNTIVEVADPDNFTVDGINYHVLSKDDLTVEVAKYGDDKYSGDIVIPATVTYNGKPYKVRAIGDYAFDGCSDLTSIVIPEGVTSAGYSAFSDCTGLTSITLPDGLTVLGDFCFNGCSNLDSVTFPEGFTTIPSNCFKMCKLTSFTIPESVTTIGTYAFQYCDFTAIKVPNGLTELAQGVFDGCFYLSSITIPESVKTIGPWALGNCDALNSIIIPEGVTTIGDDAFCNDSGLLSVSIPSTVTSIGASAFAGCVGLSSVTLPEAVISIGDRAFMSCQELTSIVIPASVKEMGYGVFGGTKLDKIEVAEGNLFYKSVDGVLYDIDVKTLIMCPPARTEGLMIPPTVTTLGAESFYECSMPLLAIPSSVNAIGKFAFYSRWNNIGKIYCGWTTPLPVSNLDGSNGKLTSATLYVPQGTKAKYEAVEPWKNFSNIIEEAPTDETFTVDGITYHVVSQEDMTVEVIKSEDNSYSGDIIIPDKVTNYCYTYTVTAVGDGAFQGCTDITSVAIPRSVTAIGYEAFERCSNLTSFAMADGVETIGANAFMDCSHLTSITIPEKVTSIGEYAFTGSGLTEVWIPALVTEIGEAAFSATPMTSLGVDENNRTYRAIDNVLYDYDVTKLIMCPTQLRKDGVVIPDGVTEIGSSAFAYCKVPSIVIPESVTTIDDYAFIGFIWSGAEIYCNWQDPIECTGTLDVSNNMYTQATLYIPQGTRSKYASVTPWKDFENVVEMTDPDYFTVDGIHYHVLSNNPPRVEVITDHTMTYAGDIVIPETVSHYGRTYNVASIDGVAFKQCTGLTSVSIPGSVMTIGADAFFGCSALTSVTMAEGILAIGSRAFYGCTALTSISIPEGVENILYEAFVECGLTSILLPASLVKIEEEVFAGNDELASIEVAEENPVYRSIDGVVYDADLQTLVVCPPGRTEDLVIPESVSTIAASAFAHCQIPTITIPASVTKIESCAFEGQQWGDETRIYCNWQEPIECTDPLSVSNDIYKATLYVPEGTKEKYESMEPWNKFSNIVEAVKTGIENVLTLQNGQPEVTVVNGALMVNGVDAATTVTVYDMLGRAVYSAAGCATVNLPAGLYLVTAGAHTAKVVLR